MQAFDDRSAGVMAATLLVVAVATLMATMALSRRVGVDVSDCRLWVSLKQSGQIADVEFGCGAGEVLAIFGPSGSGKTTILRAIAGLYQPDRASVQSNGATWTDTTTGTFVPPAQARRRVRVPGIRALSSSHRRGERRDGARASAARRPARARAATAPHGQVGREGAAAAAGAPPGGTPAGGPRAGAGSGAGGAVARRAVRRRRLRRAAESSGGGHRAAADARRADDPRDPRLRLRGAAGYRCVAACPRVGDCLRSGHDHDEPPGPRRGCARPSALARSSRRPSAARRTTG